MFFSGNDKIYGDRSRADEEFYVWKIYLRIFLFLRIYADSLINCNLVVKEFLILDHREIIFNNLTFS